MITSLLDFVRELMDGEDTATAKEHEHAIELSAAALMLEVARADNSRQSIELDAIALILKSEFNQPEENVQTLISAASERVESATDLYQFTQLINLTFSYQEKLKLVHAMWRVAFADGHIEAIEDHIIRRVAGLLHVPHEDFIRMKISARDGDGTSE